MFGMITAFIAAALASLPPPTVRPGERVFPDARPALWVVNDHDTVIYLFGTFHALDGQSEWFNDEVETAFTASDELVLETIVPAAPGPVANLHTPPKHSPVAPVGPVAGSASFLSTSKMVMSAGRSHGMTTEKGADTVLRRAAEEVGKPVSGLESFEYQISMFSRMPGTAKPASPEAAATMSKALASVLAHLQEAWNRGDVEGFSPMLEDMRQRSPESYKMLFADRNARWAAWIAQRLEQPGTVFVAVGAGHLAGRDSVQLKLAQSGIRSARIN